MVADHEGGRIVVSDLAKSFGDVSAVDDLNFVVEPGAVTGFLGPNGAGKTTTLRILLGLITQDSGSATIDGRAYRDLPRPADEVGAVLEASGFHPARSGRHHLGFLCRVNGYSADRADAVLEAVGLTSAARRAVRGYSLGMRQRLALAAALLGDPSTLVLDEPANGLDPEGIAWLRGLLRGFADEGRTVLLSSHVLAEMEHLADRIVIVNRGRVVSQGALAEVRGQRKAAMARSPEVARLADVLLRDQVGEAAVERIGSDGLRVAGMTAEELGRAAHTAGIPLSELTDHHSDLEAVFLTMTRADGMTAAGDRPG
jgi:ABC-2 type transport system ATP-binding protein